MIMKPDAPVCLCFNVSKRKIVNYCKRENPPVASLISECLSAGTGCGWCVPFIKQLHQQVKDGQAEPDIKMTSEEYASGRADFRNQSTSKEEK
jgi:NAD(P)H-nitrite reductase large subunit